MVRERVSQEPQLHGVIVSERLAGSPYLVKIYIYIYGYCAISTALHSFPRSVMVGSNYEGTYYVKLESRLKINTKKWLTVKYLFKKIMTPH